MQSEKTILILYDFIWNTAEYIFQIQRAITRSLQPSHSYVNKSLVNPVFTVTLLA